MNSSGIDWYFLYFIGQPFEGVEYTCGGIVFLIIL